MKKNTEKGLAAGIAIGASAALLLSSKKVQRTVSNAAKRVANTKPRKEKADASKKASKTIKKVTTVTKQKVSAPAAKLATKPIAKALVPKKPVSR